MSKLYAWKVITGSGKSRKHCLYSPAATKGSRIIKELKADFSPRLGPIGKDRGEG